MEIFACVAYLLVGHCVIPPEETCSDEVGHDDINRIVVMSKEDAKNSHCKQSPAAPVVPPEPSRRICGEQDNQGSYNVEQNFCSLPNR